MKFLRNHLLVRKYFVILQQERKTMSTTTKTEIISMLSDVNREGISSVISYLHHSDYFAAHCHHHHRYEGGLADHSLDVYHRMREMEPALPDESCRIVALFHDICTSHLPGYDAVGHHHHGQRSLDLLDTLGMELLEEERMAICRHMHHVPSKDLNEQTALWNCLHKCDKMSATHHHSHSFAKYVLIWAMLICSFIPAYALDRNEQYPAWCATTTNLNIRSANSPRAEKIATVPTRTYLQVKAIDDKGWAEIEYEGRTAYCAARYLRYVEAVREQAPSRDYIDSITSSVSSSGVWSWVFGIAVVAFVLAVLRQILMVILGWMAILFFKLYPLISLPFYIMNWLQRYLAKPWRTLYKRNTGTDRENEQRRDFLEGCKIPLYIVLTPLRFVNAVYFNLVVHCSFEMFNYLVEVIVPENSKEGGGNFVMWAVLLPWRVAKYVVWHWTLTFIESCIWTVIDTFVPALTLYHGTDYAASVSITQGPGRVCEKGWFSGVWNVGGGNYAGNGIYFAPVRSTANHYSAGSLIVCRVSLGRTLDLGLAPKHIYNQCGHANATGATDWGLKNGYVTGEWWRGDSGWWEYCMYDWKNRYNDSWRIRPLYVLNLNERLIQRIPGGMYHWLFNRMAIADLYNYVSRKLQ